MKIGDFEIVFQTLKSGKFSAVIFENGKICDAVSGGDLEKVKNLALQAVDFYSLEG